MSQPDAILRFIDDLPTEFFVEFDSDMAAVGIDYVRETRPNEAYAGVEFYLNPAILFYVGKPFINEFLKRAAQHFNDIAYPRAKKAFADLLRKVFRSHRPIRILATPGKVKYPESQMFAFFSKARNGDPSNSCSSQLLVTEIRHSGRAAVSIAGRALGPDFIG